MTDTVAHPADRPLDDATLDESTAHYARPRLTEEVTFASLFVFRLGAEWLGLPTSLLVSVASPPPVHSLPHRRGSAVAGLVNVGGDLVVHVSLAGFLGIDPGEAAPASEIGVTRAARRLVVLGDDRGRLATTVDEVWGVHHHDPAQFRSAPPTLTRAPASFTFAMLDVDGRIVACLDPVRVMDALSVAIA